MYSLQTTTPLLIYSFELAYITLQKRSAAMKQWRRIAAVYGT